MKTILITGALPYSSINLEFFKENDFKILYLKNEYDAIDFNVDKIEYIICNNLFAYHDISLFKNLKYIQLTSVGYDRVPMDYIKKNNIFITNARGVYSIPMAEFVIFSILNILKSNNVFYEHQIIKKWEKNRGIIELYKKTVCIIGCGNIGNECAIRLNAFGCNILGIDKNPYKNDLYDEMKKLDYLNETLSKSDIVVLTLPLEKESYHLINKERLDAMKKNSILINVSRGQIIDEEALIKTKDKFLGIALDVFENEPLDKDNELWNLSNIHITPHNSFIGDGNSNRMIDLIENNLKKYTI